MKRAIIEAAEVIEETAESIYACNTVAVGGGEFEWDSTDAMEEYRRLKKLAKRLRAKYWPLPRPLSEWRPIETAPKDGRFVDLWNGGRVTDARWCTPDGHCEDHKAWCFLEAEEAVEGRGIRWNWWELDRVPTHWMQLPAPPTQESEND